MKRICFLVDSIFTIGGVQRVTSVIAKEMSKGADITIVTFDKPEMKDTTCYHLGEAPISYRFFSYPETGKVKQCFCKMYSGFYRKFQPQWEWCSNLYALSSYPSEYRRALSRELSRGNYDIIIGVHAPLAVRLATVRKRLPGVKLIGWSHNSFEALFGDTSMYIGPDRKRHYVYQFRKLDQVVLLCQHDVDTYRRYDPLFHPVYIYNPLTLEPGNRSEGRSKRFLAIGRFSPKHKGFDLLIEAFRLFAQTNSTWCLDIVGEGEEESMYRDLIARYCLEDRVTIHPFTSHVQDYYSQAQVYVLSSRWEGFGLVLVEAMAHGLPVISSDLPTSLEIMGGFGIYFKNGNISELAQRLEEATAIDWAAKSEEALKTAGKFNLENIIGKWKATLGL